MNGTTIPTGRDTTYDSSEVYRPVKEDEGGGALAPMVLTFGGTTQEEADGALIQGAKLNATWQEINNAFRQGKRIIVITNPYIEETIATFVAGEILGVSGAQGAGAGLVDAKFSVQFVWGQKGSDPNILALRCDNATDYPQSQILVG